MSHETNFSSPPLDERPLTANDVDAIAGELVSCHGYLSPKAQLTLEAFNDGVVSAEIAVAYLIQDDAATLAAGALMSAAERLALPSAHPESN